MHRYPERPISCPYVTFAQSEEILCSFAVIMEMQPLHAFVAVAEVVVHGAATNHLQQQQQQQQQPQEEHGPISHATAAQVSKVVLLSWMACIRV
jgi:hypothetical protein